ncbi:hypothetical protein LCGC14_1893810 [marine sediment metagenome]|uniref:Uncharacterized protein n=1 Tax=marine sediment metagenome TaxID=412755 RepID=A0A0F9FYY6_9ZZZZ
MDTGRGGPETQVRVEVFLKLPIIGMVPRKRSTGPEERQGTIYEDAERENPLGFYFLGGKKLWEACGRGVEYEAELVLMKGQMKRDG